MAHKSIVDRVLILAAAICAAALVWQLTVLLTSKGRSSSGASLVAVASAPPPAAEVAQPAAPAPAAVRVVYAGTEPSAKTSVKASDPPIPAAEPEPATARHDPPAAMEAQSSAANAGAPDQPTTGPLALVSNQPADVVPAEAVVDQTGSTPASSGSPGRVDVAAVEPPTPGDDPVATKPASTGAINLNRASIEALNHIKGAGHIGQAIVSHRPYKSVEDLVKKRVLRRGVYEQIKQMVVAE